MTHTTTGVVETQKRSAPTRPPRTTLSAARPAHDRAVAALADSASAFLSLYDLGRSLVDTGRRTPTRQTLIRRGAEFAAKNGMTVHEVGRDRYVSSAELRRLHEAVAA